MSDIETVPDAAPVPAGWPEGRVPEATWHSIVAFSSPAADIRRGADGSEAYALTDRRSGGEPGWNEGRPKAFWCLFDAGYYPVVTWNGQAVDMPTILERSMIHGIGAAARFRRDTGWEGYRHRFAGDWHIDHTLRRTAATWLRIARVDVRAAADLLGMSVQAAVKIYGQWTLEGQDAAADGLAWSRGVKAAHCFAITVPASIEVAVPRGLPPREHPAQTERRKRERIRAQDHAGRKRIGAAFLTLRA
ncbi:hypothetical protein [Methylobacterium oryzae]|uniref:hypothetical protein n=1 Tax=Methylobacterium oryzae TaxID=334852 RepID=UPI002F3530FA